MDLRGLDDNKSRFVCPSDRQLALRAKLHTGWSSVQTSGALDSHEQAAIIAVIKRNEQLETAERQRVGRLVERVENIKLRAAECGPRFCRLCGQSFGILGPCKQVCENCKKPMCSKCAIELRQSKVIPKDILLCKICSETRELWMKTGAWFYKEIPKFEAPVPRVQPPRMSPARGLAARAPQAATPQQTEAKPVKLRIRCVDTSSEEDESDGAGSCASTGEHHFTRDRPSSFLRKHPLFNRKPEPTPSPPPQPSSAFASTIVEWETVSIASRQHLQQQHHHLHTNGTTINSGSLSRRGSVSSSMSMSETSSANSSNTGGMVVLSCKEPSLGWLELVLSYAEADHTLDCAVVRARDLPAMDAAGLADPFCKVNIITEYGTAKQKKWYSTRTVHKSVNPEFNETVRFLGVEPEELANSTLYVVVLDDDRYGHDYLGAGRVHLGPVYHADCRMSIPLETEDRHSVEAAVSGPWPNGQILVALCYNTRRRALMVLVKRCSNLMARDKNGQSDPFVKLQIKPDAHRNKKGKTSIKWRTLNPVYNEEFVFETRPNELDKQSVQLAVWDKDLGKSNDFLGSLQIGAHSKGRRLKQWKDCIRQPDQYHEQWHYLSNDQSGH